MRIHRQVIVLAVLGTFAAAPSLVASASVTGPSDRSLSGSSGRIAFAADASGSYQIYTVRPDGSDLRQITHIAGDAENPDWSPDGRQIVFEIDSPTDARLAVMDADGSHLTVMPLSGPGFEAQPAYTPDGRQLVFLHSDGTTYVAVFKERLDGSGLTRVTPTSLQFTDDPNVSPDGHTVSFVAATADPVDIRQALDTISINGTHLRRLTSYAADVGVKQSWSPDGRRITFTRHADNSPAGTSANVATIDARGGPIRMLTTFRGGEPNAFTGSYSPDGRWIVYRLAAGGTYSLRKFHPDGTGDTQILSLPGLIPRFIDWGQ